MCIAGCENRDLARAMFLIAVRGHCIDSVVPECSPLNRCLCLSFQDRDNSGGIEWKEFVGLLAAFARDNVEGTMSAGECCWHSLLT